MAVLRFGQQADVAWRMTIREVWHLVDVASGSPAASEAMDKEGFAALRKKLNA